MSSGGTNTAARISDLVNINSAMKMEAVYLSETLVHSYQDARESTPGYATGPLWREIHAYREFLPLTDSAASLSETASYFLA
jgi:hypothetical protein